MTRTIELDYPLELSAIEEKAGDFHFWPDEAGFFVYLDTGHQKLDQIHFGARERVPILTVYYHDGNEWGIQRAPKRQEAEVLFQVSQLVAPHHTVSNQLHDVLAIFEQKPNRG